MDGFHVATERFQTKEGSHQLKAVNVVLRFCFGPSASYFSAPMTAPQPLFEASVYRMISILAFGVQRA